MSALNYVSANIALFFDGMKLADSLYGAFRQDRYQEERETSVISTINRVAILALQTGEFLGVVKGASPRFLGGLKTGEFVLRCVAVPIRVKELGRSFERNKIEFIERAIISPVSDVLRVVSEIDIYEESHYLKQYEKKGEDATRPIYETDFEGHSYIVGYRKVDPEECRKAIESGRSFAEAVAKVGLVSEAAVFSSSLNLA